MIKELWKKYKNYVISVLIALLTGGISALLTMKNMDLFDIVEKPPLSPPAILFPIVWSILYVLMGISAARIFDRRGQFPSEAESALGYYLSSLVVNFAWSIIFFNFEAYLIAFVWLLLLLALIVLTVIKYYHIDRTAAFLQIPYIAWVAFAGYLNFGIFLLN